MYSFMLGNDLWANVNWVNTYNPTPNLTKAADTISFSQESEEQFPSEVKWTDTTFTYTVPADKSMRVLVKLPSQFMPYIVSSDGLAFYDLTKKIFNKSKTSLRIELGQGDSINIGGSKTITMNDYGNYPQGKRWKHFNGYFKKINGIDTYFSHWRQLQQFKRPMATQVAMTVPLFSFTSCGVSYYLDWNKFAQERNIAKGAFNGEWGYSTPNNPTDGVAGLYEGASIVELDWGNLIDSQGCSCPSGYEKDEDGNCVPLEEEDEENNWWLLAIIAAVATFGFIGG